jgi:hypothetical protein
MKTALQEVFSRLEELHPRLFDIYTPEGRDFVREFHKFMELEKQQIIEAHGLIAKLQEDGSHKLISGETYYNETYKPSA